MNNNFLTKLFKPNKGRNVTGGGINSPDVTKLFQQGQQQTRVSYTRPTILEAQICPQIAHCGGFYGRFD